MVLETAAERGGRGARVLGVVEDGVAPGWAGFVADTLESLETFSGFQKG